MTNTTEFRARIRKSLANPTMQLALDLNAERRVTRRLNALESLPDWRERRQQAHAIRAEVIEHLDQYLDQFIAKAQANGVTVHRAKDAAEAVRIVIDIAKNNSGMQELALASATAPTGQVSHRTPEILVAKSKIMVS